MGFSDLFKKTNYFDPKMNPQCSYCQFGKRTKEGGRIFCEKKGLMEETASCSKFVYSPLKRIPVKQLEIEGALVDDEMYVEVNDDQPTAAEKEKAEAAAKAEAEAQAKAEAEAKAAAEEAEAAAKQEAEAAETAQPAETQSVQETLNDIDAVLAEYDTTKSVKSQGTSDLNNLAALAEAAALVEGLEQSDQ